MLMLTRSEHELLTSAFIKLHAVRYKDRKKVVQLKAEGSSFEITTELLESILIMLAMRGNETANKQGLIKITTNRRSLRAYQSYLKHFIFSLTTRVLPEYDRRVKIAEPAVAGRLRNYITMVKSKLTITQNLLSKVEKELNK